MTLRGGKRMLRRHRRSSVRGLLFLALVGCGARSGLFASGSIDGGAGDDADDASAPQDQAVATQDSTVADAATANDSANADWAAEQDSAEPVPDVTTSDVSLDADAGCGRGGPGAADASCNAFAATSTTSVAPNAPASGLLFFVLESSGCACASGGALQEMRMCADSITVTPTTTIAQKCMSLVNAINGMCGSGSGQANFRADGTNCSLGTFAIRDLACDGHVSSGTGLTLVLSSAESSAQASGALVDDEQDLLANGCQLQGNSLAMLHGSPTGVAINGTQSGVVFVVSTPTQGAVIEGVVTDATMTAGAIASLAVAKANISLTAIGSNVRCAQDLVVPTVVSCTVNASGDGGGAPIGVPVTFQVNDRGLARTVMSGPAGDIQAAAQLIRAAHGLPNVLTYNFVGGTTCSPCDGGVSGPTCCR
jgi:hypothetical protein